jgi:hypothetical protein
MQPRPNGPLASLLPPGKDEREAGRPARSSGGILTRSTSFSTSMADLRYLLVAYAPFLASPARPTTSYDPDGSQHGSSCSRPVLLRSHAASPRFSRSGLVRASVRVGNLASIGAIPAVDENAHAAADSMLRKR